MKITYSEMQRKFSESKKAMDAMNIHGYTVFGDLDKQILELKTVKEKNKRKVFTLELDEKSTEDEILVNLLSYNITKEGDGWIFEEYHKD